RGGTKPPTLPQCGSDAKRDRGFRFVPDPVGIAGDDVKPIETGTKIGVNRFSPAHGQAPLRLEAIQLESKLHTFPCRQIQPLIFDDDPPGARPRQYRAGGVAWFTIQLDPSDMYDGRSRSAA